MSAVIAFDPGFAKSFDSKSIGKIKNKTYIFIAEKLYTPFDEIYSKEFSGLVGKENSEIVPSSVHMSFLQACQAKYPKEDPELSELCANNDLKIEIQEKNSSQNDLISKVYLVKIEFPSFPYTSSVISPKKMCQIGLYLDTKKLSV